MRYIIVTSEVTFVPKNYSLFLEALISDVNIQPYAIVILKNRNLFLLIKAMILVILGARRLGITLLINYLSTFIDNRKTIAKNAKIHFRFFNSVNEEEFLNFLKQEKISLIINARTRCIYKKEVLTSTIYPPINIHHGLLPKNRGVMCDLFALTSGQDAGFSIHEMNEKIDNGPILLTKVTTPKENKEKSYSEHLKRSSIIEGRVLATLLNDSYLLSKYPKTLPNYSDDTTTSYNPTSIQIRSIINRGYHL